MQTTCSVVISKSGNVLHDRTGRVISEPEPQQPEPDTPAEACQQQAPSILCYLPTLVKSTRVQSKQQVKQAPVDKCPPCVSDGQERSPPVGSKPHQCQACPCFSAQALLATAAVVYVQRHTL